MWAHLPSKIRGIPSIYIAHILPSQREDVRVQAKKATPTAPAQP